jgi:hypothetical protein
VQLPFTPADFFDVFGRYNTNLWPAALALWVASAALVAAAIRMREPPHRALSALLAVHWAWSGLAYHAAFFTRINPAAWLFATLFLAQAALLVWYGVVRGRLRFSSSSSPRGVVAGALVIYSLLYPVVNLTLGMTYPRVPIFGVPCPTTIFTAGLLLAASPPDWRLATIPVLWSMVGGSAALLLGVGADLILFLAGGLLVANVAVGRSRDPAEEPRDLLR